MRITIVLVVPVALAALLAVACSGSGRPGEPDVTATTVPSEPSITATWAVQTGISPVDTFLNLMASKDLDTIEADTAFRQIPCEKDSNVADGPLLACTGTEADGTLVDAIVRGCFPFSAVRKDELRQRIDWLADDAMTLEAVHEVDATNSAYALQFIEQGTPPAPAYTRTIVYLTDDGRLAGYASCGEFTEPSGTVTQVWP